MRINKHRTFWPFLSLSGLVVLTMVNSANAQSPLSHDYSPQVSHSVGSQHNHHRQDNRHRQHNNHYRHIDPWRWGLGWGPSIGFSWSNSNHWRYGFGWGYDNYRRGRYGYYPYQNQFNTIYRPQKVEVANTVVTPPKQITTHIEYASGLRHLPENAKVIQRENGTVYEWQGVEYFYNWNAQTYQVVTSDSP